MRSHKELGGGPCKHLRSPTPAYSATLSELQPLLASLGITACAVILPGFAGARQKAMAAAKQALGQMRLSPLPWHAACICRCHVRKH